MAVCEPLFELENRLKDDECALADRVRQSDEASGYVLANFLASNVPGCDLRRVTELAACHNNLHFRDGYGVANACVIDADSTSRLGAAQTNNPHRIGTCLKNRVFQGHAHFYRGAVQPEQEAELIHSEMSRERRPCKGDIPPDRFAPLLPCLKEVMQNPATVIMDQTRGGSNSRAWVRDEDALARCGYSKDGRSWKKK